MNPTEPNVPAIRQRRPKTEARLKANRKNAKKAALSGRSGRPRGSIDGNRLSLRERCRVRDEEHVATLERIAADDSHPGFQLVAIRDLMDRGWGRPSQSRRAQGYGRRTIFLRIRMRPDKPDHRRLFWPGDEGLRRRGKARAK